MFQALSNFFKHYFKKKKLIQYEDSNPEFTKWAFGKDFKGETTLDRMKAWNKLHGHLLMLKETDEIHSSLCKMGGLWVQYGQDEVQDESSK